MREIALKTWAVITVLGVIFGLPLYAAEPEPTVEQVTEAIVEEVKEEVKPKPKSCIETSSCTAKDNPKKCDLGGTEVMWPDGSCHKISAPVVYQSTPTVTGCESFRAVTAKYFPANQVDNALFVFSKESGCTHPTPVNATNDSGLCQLHSEYIVDLNAHVKRCSEKFYNARIGSNNWSAWYAVCSVTAPGASLFNPVSLYGLPCN